MEIHRYFVTQYFFVLFVRDKIWAWRWENKTRGDGVSRSY